MVKYKTSGQPDFSTLQCFLCKMITFNQDDGYTEAIIRGYKSGILSQADYSNLGQCGSLEGGPPQPQTSAAADRRGTDVRLPRLLSGKALTKITLGSISACDEVSGAPLALHLAAEDDT